MQVVSSYGAEIKNKNIPIRHTLALYREAVRCLTEIYETVWTELSMIDQIKRRFNEAEHLVHETKKNHARFDFDARFPKMPKSGDPACARECFLVPYKIGTVEKWSDFRKTEACI